jgi:hypothetical protein
MRAAFGGGKRDHFKLEIEAGYAHHRDHHVRFEHCSE